jgi:hypothetical protein
MKKSGIFIFFMALGIFLMSQFNPQTKRITEKFFPEKNEVQDVTPALKKRKGFTNYKEMIAFLEDICEKNPEYAQIEYIGKSKKGCAIPLLHIRNQSSKPKLRVWLQGGLHGDEPGSTEALLYLIYELFHNPNLKTYVQELEIAIVPMANIDGYVKQKRNNAENLDLNRDQTKLMAHESIFLKKAFTKFSPQVALDFHEYRPFRRDFIKMGSQGVTGYYDVMFLQTGNHNVSQKIKSFNNDVFLAETRKKLDEHQLTHFDYVTTKNHHGNIHFSLGGTNPRSSVTNYSLQNCISSLIEVRGVGIGRTSFKRRIFTSFLIAQTYLETALNQHQQINEILKNAFLDSNKVTVRTTPKIYDGKLSFIDIDQVAKVDLDVTFRNNLLATPTQERTRPLGYIFESELAFLIPKIQSFGFKVDTFSQAKKMKVEVFVVNQYKKEPQKFEKMTMQSVQCATEKSTVEISKGAFYVSMNQIQNKLLPELFEPEAVSSFVRFGLIPTNLNQTLPIYRHIQK